MTWEKLPPVEKPKVGCSNCHSKGVLGHMNMALTMGFGNVHVTKDDEEIYMCQGNFAVIEGKIERELRWQLKDVEAIAVGDPDHDWRVAFFGPMYECEYQRHGPNEWFMISTAPGFESWE